MNTELKYTASNQTVVTETVVEFVQQDSTLSQRVMGEKHQVSGTYNINGKLCFPVGTAPNASSVQFLTHGVGFAKSYWDFFSAQYSYQDAAALKGYTTFAYDRLGTGLSDHPDPIQVVQGPLEVAIAHSLIQLLRSGSIASTSFKKVIGVGHSFGSDITNAITAQYPEDVDAAVLTGFSVDSKGMIPFLSGLDLVLANEAQPLRFGALPNGYLITESQAGNQFSFFRFPGFAQELLEAGTAAGETFTIGEFFTQSAIMTPTPGFTGPIDVVNGENDLPFCDGNCVIGDKPAAVKAALYPNAAASSMSYIAKDAGHGLNLHYAAADAYAQIFGFLASNGFA